MIDMDQHMLNNLLLNRLVGGGDTGSDNRNGTNNNSAAAESKTDGNSVGTVGLSSLGMAAGSNHSFGMGTGGSLSNLNSALSSVSSSMMFMNRAQQQQSQPQPNTSWSLPSHVSSGGTNRGDRGGMGAADLPSSSTPLGFAPGLALPSTSNNVSTTGFAQGGLFERFLANQGTDQAQAQRHELLNMEAMGNTNIGRSTNNYTNSMGLSNTASTNWSNVNNNRSHSNMRNIELMQQQLQQQQQQQQMQQHQQQQQQHQQQEMMMSMMMNTHPSMIGSGSGTMGRGMQSNNTNSSNAMSNMNIAAAMINNTQDFNNRGLPNTLSNHRISFPSQLGSSSSNSTNWMGGATGLGPSMGSTAMPAPNQQWSYDSAANNNPLLSGLSTRVGDGGGGGGAGALTTSRGVSGSNSGNQGNNEAASSIGFWSAASASLLGDLALNAKEKTQKKLKGSRKNNRDRPKRPLSAYNIFFKEERKRILDEVMEVKDIAEAIGSKSGSPKGKEANDPDERKSDCETIVATSTPDVAASTKTSSAVPPVAQDMVDAMKRDRQQHPHGKIDFQSLAKIIGKRWKSLDSFELERYKSTADIDMKRYRKEMEEYQDRFLTKKEGPLEEKLLKSVDGDDDDDDKAAVASASAAALEPDPIR